MIDSAIVNVESTMQPEGRPPEAPVDQSSTDKIFQDRFNQLAKRERMLRQQEQKYKSFEDNSSKYDDLTRKIKESPIDALEELGIKYEDLISKGLSSDPTSKLAQKIEQLEARLKQKEELELEQSENSRKSEMIASIRSELADNDDYDLVNSFGAHDKIYDKIYAHYEETGEVLDIREAAKQIEDDIFDKVNFLKKSKKISNFFMEDLKAKEAQSTEKVEDKMNQGSFTLSNNMTTNSAPQQGISSEQERVQAAINALKQLRGR